MSFGGVTETVLSLASMINDSRSHDMMTSSNFPRNWPFVREIHRSPVNSPHKGQWRGALIFSLICVWINGWVNNLEAGDLRRSRAHYDVIVMNEFAVTSKWCSSILYMCQRNGISFVQRLKRRPAIIWSNPGILTVGPLGIDFNQCTTIFTQENQFINDVC